MLSGRDGDFEHVIFFIFKYSIRFQNIIQFHTMGYEKTGVDPVIVDIVDKIPMIQQQHYKRRKIYKKLGYTITKVDAI